MEPKAHGLEIDLTGKMFGVMLAMLGVFFMTRSLPCTKAPTGKGFLKS
jgi:hypothetical protein